MIEHKVFFAYKVQLVNQNIRHQILEVTQRIAYGRGVSAVRMDEVAYELGMSKKTLYTYFRSKEELLKAMLVAKYARHTSQFKEVLDSNELDYLTRLESLMRLGWQANNEFSNAVLQDMRRKAPQLWSMYEQLHETLVYNALQQALTQGQQQDWLRKDMRMDIFLDIFLSRTGFDSKRNYSMGDALDTFFLLMLNGILSKNTVPNDLS